MKYLIGIFIVILILSCGKDEPECIHPELYGDWNYHKHRIVVNENDILDTLSISDRYGALTINKNEPSYFTYFDGKIDTIDIVVDTTTIKISLLQNNTYTSYLIDSITQDYLEFHCDCSGRFGDIDTDVFITYKLIK